MIFLDKPWICFIFEKKIFFYPKTMKILRIRFENIHSFASEVDIDFEKEPLAGARLFAIVGPTGAGKTTILDVITLAIYGRTPRMEDINKSNVEKYGSVISRGTDKAWAEVTYSTGGKSYISRWLLERNRKGKLKEVEMELIDAQTNMVLAGKVTQVKKLNEEIIGLDYGQFVKSVVLAQGEFSKFLKADSDERLKLLEKITGDTIFRDISKKAHDIAGAIRKEIELLEQTINTREVLSGEQIAELEARKKDLTEKNNLNLKQKQNLETIARLKENILQLENKILQSEEEKRSILLEKKKHENDFARLERFKILQEKSRELTSWQKVTETLMSLQKKVSALELEEQKIRDESQKVKAYREETAKKLEELKKEIEAKKPVLEEVRKLDNDLIGLGTKLSEKNETLRKLEQERKNGEINLQKLTEQLRAKTETARGHEKFLEQNAILEKLETVLGKMELTASEYDAKNKELEAFLSQNNIRLPNGSLEVKKAFLTKETDKLQKELEQIEQEKTLSKNIEQLQEMQREKNVLLNELNILVNILEQSEALENEIRKLSDEHQKLVSSAADTDKHLDALENEKEKLQLKLQVAEAEYQNSLLSEHIKVLRNNLKENSPCPVCGSVHHPQASQPVTSDAEEKKQNVEKAKEALEKHIEEIRKLQLKQKEIRTLLENLTDRIKQANSKLDELEQNKKSLTRKNNIDIKNSAHAHKIIEHTRNEIEAIARELKILNTQTQLENKLSLYSAAIEKFVEVLRLRTALGQLLKPYLEKYLQQKSASATQTINILSQWYEKYKKTKDELQKLKSEQERLSFAAEQASQRIKQISEEIEKVSAGAAIIKSEYGQKANRRKELLGGVSPDEYERKMNEEISKIKDAVAAADNKLSSLDASVEQLHVQLKETLAQAGQAEESKKMLENDLLPFVAKLGYENIDKALEDWIDAEQVSRLEEMKLSLEKQLAAVEQRIKDFDKELKTLRQQDNSEYSLDELKEKIALLNETSESLNRQIGEIEQKLKSDKEQKDKLRQMQEELEGKKKEYEIWDALDRLIGSSSGDKFVRIALEISMRELMRIANRFLKRFTDRYEMFVQPMDERGVRKSEIFVRDLYRAGNERSVRTLSGGETFLVSLSLALALSYMASRNVTIQSLFIDEGFGTLDQETLDTALTALQKLHEGTERKIGIISHVEALKERIGVKISVERKSSGYSELKIIA